MNKPIRVIKVIRVQRLAVKITGIQVIRGIMTKVINKDSRGTC